ncbi:MAG TPA: hypothetical protein VGI70_21260 [Polyangiales bacterium]
MNDVGSARPRAGPRGAARIRPDNNLPMDAPDEHGRKCHGILKIHLLDPTGSFGGFYEEAL